MWKRFGLIIFIIILSVPAFASFQVFYNATLFMTTDNQLKLSWTAQDAATRYEVNIYNVERDLEEPAGTGTVTTNTITFQLPRSGHYICKLRACDDTECSDWTGSDGGEWSIKDREPGSFWVYGYVQDPGTIIIGSKNSKDKGV